MKVKDKNRSDTTGAFYANLAFTHYIETEARRNNDASVEIFMCMKVKDKNRSDTTGAFYANLAFTHYIMSNSAGQKVSNTCQTFGLSRLCTDLSQNNKSEDPFIHGSSGKQMS